MISYLIRSLAHHFVSFFYDWYVRSFYLIFSKAFDSLRFLEKTIALKVTVQFWFQPLYQDYTLLGYLVGFPARTLRIIFGIALYGFVLTAFAFAYLIWALLLPIVVYKIMQ